METSNIKTTKKRAPFDSFGIAPTLNIRGDEKTVTYLGCSCTIIMFLSILATSLYFFLKFLNKEDSKTSSTIITTKTYPALDLYEKKFLMIVQFKYFGIQLDYKKIEAELIEIKAYIVTQKKGDKPPI